MHCLTQRPDNELVWAHYANSFKDHLIESDGDHPFFNTNDPDLEGLQGMIAVDYRAERPVIDQFVDETNSLRTLFFIKPMAWENEEEWRMMRIFSDQDAVVGEDQSVHLFPFPLDSVTRIWAEDVNRRSGGFAGSCPSIGAHSAHLRSGTRPQDQHDHGRA